MKKNLQPILPPATIGIFGSGQLGRMLAMAARRMGYGVGVYSPERNTPAGAVADFEIVAEYDDLASVREFVRRVEVVTFEFENIPATTLALVAESRLVHPSPAVLHIAQNRIREKQWLSSHGFPVARFMSVRSADELSAALNVTGDRAVAKTAGFGYDGKGQHAFRRGDNLAAVWERLATGEAIVEQQIDFELEMSVIIARTRAGEISHFDVTRNDHANHILDISSAPAGLHEDIDAAARQIAIGIAEQINLVGVMGVEMFVSGHGDVVVNEIAPRTHNSGHWTLNAAATSQFEQQIRAVCNLPLGSPERMMPVAMANILGDLWAGGTPKWAAALTDPRVHLHLYGKAEARPGRKMGHITALGKTREDAVRRAVTAREMLRG